MLGPILAVLAFIVVPAWTLFIMHRYKKKLREQARKPHFLFTTDNEAGYSFIQSLKEPYRTLFVVILFVLMSAFMFTLKLTYFGVSLLVLVFGILVLRTVRPSIRAKLTPVLLFIVSALLLFQVWILVRPI